ncbi:phosphopantetheine-binding protein, partial [Microbulbifer aggregans]|uniref:phosphopantetheine-binding protein n=1 Tax=Microbulbifer aggregans TaxID=1769779 RepID=UPI001CFEDB33
DSALNLLPVGAVGELYIGGAGLARGYLNRPELTAERFIDNPFASEPDLAKGYNRLYKTGDLVRWLPDGNLEYLGRNDSQVKVRGYRIELGEIETALSKLPEIKQAVVIDRERAGDILLAAYLVLQDDAELVPGALAQALSERLPDYMVPASYTEIAQIPLTINGKLDRRALPEPSFNTAQSYVAPRTDLEASLCQLWQQVLGVERVGIYDNFFHLGGNSISAVRLSAAARQQLQLDISLVQLFEQKTIAALVKQLSPASQREIPKTALARTPLSFAQERLLFIERFEK